MHRLRHLWIYNTMGIWIPFEYRKHFNSIQWSGNFWSWNIKCICRFLRKKVNKKVGNTKVDDNVYNGTNKLNAQCMMFMTENDIAHTAKQLSAFTKVLRLPCWCRPAYTPTHHPEHAPHINSQNFFSTKKSPTHNTTISAGAESLNEEGIRPIVKLESEAREDG